jgi:transposase
MPYATTEAMNKHLVEISVEVAPGAHADLVCDGAGWHQRGKPLVVPGNITLLSLPPYSPELNPMENVWDYLRQNELCAQASPSYDDILNACQSAWRFLINNPDRIRSIGTREWRVSLSRRTVTRRRQSKGTLSVTLNVRGSNR